MEFKGTKGEWVVKRAKMTFPSGTKWQIINENEDSLFEVELAESDEAMEANALLISKAPKMLDMLKDILWAVENSNIEANVISIEDLEKLIKEATEI
jgi:hypothetical protein